MKKLFVMLVVMAVVLGMSVGVMAWDGASESVNVNVTLNDYAGLSIPNPNLNFVFDGPGYKTKNTPVSIVTNHDVKLSAEITKQITEDEINIADAVIHSDVIGHGSYTYDLFVGVLYNVTGKVPAGDYSGEVTVTLESDSI